MRFKRAVSVVLSLIIILGCCSLFFACNKTEAKTGAVYNENWTPVNKKAMLLIPGLMASSFYNLDEDSFGEELWGVRGFVNLVGNYYAPEVDKLIAQYNELYPNEDYSQNADYLQAKNGILQSIMNKLLMCDDEGIPNYKVGICNMQSSERFASFKGMEYIYDILYPLYSNQYDIVVWQYDWRGSVDAAADELARFIDSCGYEKVQFFTHSLGSVVVANWLQEKAHREKTELFVPFGGPFLGSMDAVTNLFASEENTGIVAQLTSLTGMTVDLTQITTTMPSVYQLLPFAEYFDTNGYESTSPINIDGEDKTFDEFYSALSGLDTSLGANGALKNCIADLKEYQSRYFVKASYDEVTGKYYEDENGEYTVHDTWLVPTEYIVGVGKSTVKTANLSLNDNIATILSTVADATEFDATGSIYEKYIGTTVTSAMTADENQNASSKSMYYSQLWFGAGDGTVPAYSASAGLPLDSENVHLVYGISHGPLANNSFDLDFSPDDLTGLAYLKAIMKKYVDKTDLEIASIIAPEGTAGVDLSAGTNISDLVGQIISYFMLGMLAVFGIVYIIIKAKAKTKRS